VVGLHATGIGGFQYAVAEVGRATNHNALANYFLSAMPLLWFIGIGSKKMLVKMSAFGLLAFSFAGVLISGSRGGMVGLVVILIVMALLSKQPGLFLVGGVVLLILSIPVMGGEYLARMATILDFGGSDLSSSSRIDGLVHGIEMMIMRPILGVGPGCYPVARKAWMEWSLWAHNHYGQLAGELGVIGVVVWCRFAKDYMRRSWQFIKTKDADPWLKNIASAVFVTSILRLALGMFDHSLYRFVWFILAAIVVHLEMPDDKSKKKGQTPASRV
jgi:O-antigen ligase